MKRHINICIQIEETAGQIYQKMAESPHLSATVRQTLLELAEDEGKHASQLRFALRFPENSVVKSQPDLMVQAQLLLEQAQRLLNRPEIVKIDDQQAVNLGLKMEKDFCQAHIASSFEFADSGMKKMFAAMAQADETHVQRLVDLKNTISPSGN